MGSMVSSARSRDISIPTIITTIEQGPSQGQCLQRVPDTEGEGSPYRIGTLQYDAITRLFLAVEWL